MKRLSVVLTMCLMSMVFCCSIVYCSAAQNEKQDQVQVPRGKQYVATACYSVAEKQSMMVVVTSKQCGASEACYSIVEAKHETFDHKDKRLTGISLQFTFRVQGRELPIYVNLTPEHPAWDELKDVRARRDIVWLEVGEDGKVLNIRKKDPFGK